MIKKFETPQFFKDNNVYFNSKAEDKQLIYFKTIVRESKKFKIECIPKLLEVIKTTEKEYVEELKKEVDFVEYENEKFYFVFT